MLLKIKEMAARIGKDLWDFRYSIFAIGIYYVVTRILFHGFCPMSILTGIPCPACGMTRAVWSIFEGQLGRAFVLHPFVFGWLFLAIWLFIGRYLLGKQKLRYMKEVAILLAIAMMGYYLYRMYLYFPGNPPMDYNAQNVLQKLYPNYENILHIW